MKAKTTSITPNHPSAKRTNHASSAALAAAALEEERRFTFKSQFPQAEFRTPLNCAVDQHIWSNLNLQLNHYDCCHTSPVQDLLKAIYRKTHYVRKDGTPGYWNKQAAWYNYDARASIIAHSTYPERLAFCLCGMPRRDGNASTCNDVNFCPRCSYRLRRALVLEEFDGNFAADQEALFITFSLSKDARESTRLIYKDLTKSDTEQVASRGLCDIYLSRALPFSEPWDFEQCQVYWELFGKAIAETNTSGYLTGVFGIREIAVRFRPLGVIPHAHFIAFSSGFCDSYARELRRSLKRLIRQTRRIDDKLHPSLAIYRLTTPEDYRMVLKYLAKPITIEQAYEIAALKGNYLPEQMHDLNLEVNYFMEGVGYLFHGTRRSYRYGICHSLHSNYCGFVTPARKKKSEVERRRKRLRKAQQAADFPDSKKFRPKRARPSQFEKRLNDMIVQWMIREGELPPKPARHMQRRTASTLPADSPGSPNEPKPHKQQIPANHYSREE